MPRNGGDPFDPSMLQEETFKSIPPQHLIGAVLGGVEKRLLSAGGSERLALTHAQQHLYEAIYWIDAAIAAAGRIVRP